MKDILLFILIFTTTCVTAQSVDLREASVLEEYESYLEEAQRDEKMLLVILTDNPDTAWEKMESENIFSDAEFYRIMQNYVAVEIPINSEMGARWVQLFPVEDLPAFYFLLHSELLIKTKYGYQSLPALRTAAAEAYASRNLYDELSAKYAKEKMSVKEWTQLLDIHSLNFEYHETMALALEFLNGLSADQLLQSDVLPVLVRYGVDLQTKYPEKIIKNRKVAFPGTGEYSFEEFFARMYSYNLDLAINSGDSIFLEKFIQTVAPLNPDTAVSRRDMTFETRKLYAEETGQFGIWAKAVQEYSPGIEGDSLRAEFIFDEAFVIADSYNTEAALKASRNLAAKANTLNETFRYRMLEAYTAYLLKDFEPAEVLVRKAATLTANPNNLRKAEGLLQMIQREKP